MKQDGFGKELLRRVVAEHELAFHLRYRSLGEYEKPLVHPIKQSYVLKIHCFQPAMQRCYVLYQRCKQCIQGENSSDLRYLENN